MSLTARQLDAIAAKYSDRVRVHTMDPVPAGKVLKPKITRAGMDEERYRIRGLKIMTLLAAGKRWKEIEEELDIGEYCIHRTLERMRKRIGGKTTLHMVCIAIKKGMIEL